MRTIFSFRCFFYVSHRIQNKRAEKHKELVKNLFDYAKTADSHVANGPRELIIEDMDEEQIWQQLELQVSKYTRFKMKLNMIFICF